MTFQLQRLLSLVNEYYCSNHDVAFYANRLGMQRRPLVRLCRAELGVTAKSVISGKIVERAKELLQIVSTGEAAEALGFENAASFGRFFKRYAGYTVTQYTKKHLQ